MEGPPAAPRQKLKLSCKRNQKNSSFEAGQKRKVQQEVWSGQERKRTPEVGRLPGAGGKKGSKFPSWWKEEQGAGIVKMA